MYEAIRAVSLHSSFKGDTGMIFTAPFKSGVDKPSSRKPSK
jgi:hypothetical protein